MLEPTACATSASGSSPMCRAASSLETVPARTASSSRSNCVRSIAVTLLLLPRDPYRVDRAIRRLDDLDQNPAERQRLAAPGNPAQTFDQQPGDGLVVLALGQRQLELDVEPHDRRT